MSQQRYGWSHRLTAFAAFVDSGVAFRCSNHTRLSSHTTHNNSYNISHKLNVVQAAQPTRMSSLTDLMRDDSDFDLYGGATDRVVADDSPRLASTPAPEVRQLAVSPLSETIRRLLRRRMSPRQGHPSCMPQSRRRTDL